MKITFKNSKGRTIVLDVQGTTKISELKIMIKKEIKSEKKIRLLFSGDVMKDDDVLDDYGVEPLDSIVYTEEYEAGI